MERKKAKTNVNEDNSSRLTEALTEEIVGNEDLLIEIFLRMPAKSLVKFKCVSKHWLSLISDKSFCYNHSARSPKVASAIYYYSDLFRLKSISLKGRQNLPMLPLSDGVKEGYSISVVQSCNGLMLCWRNYCHEKYICICNLTTNKYTVLLQGCASSNPVLLACISYDPAKSPYYKVVLTRSPNLVDIYFSENKSWKRIQVTERLGKPHHKAFWNGSIHWIHSQNTHLKFEVDKETLTVLSLPQKLSFYTDEMIHYFGQCGENLILIQYRPRVTVGFRILEMKKGATLWIVKQLANLRPITQLHPGSREFHVLSVLEGSLESDVVLLLASEYKIFKYNLRSKTVEVICDVSPSEFYQFQDNRKSCSARVYHFIESLVPV